MQDTIQGTQIFYAVLAANEVVEECKKKKEGMVIKIDFEKSYNHVDCNFLNFVLQAKDFWVNEEVG